MICFFFTDKKPRPGETENPPEEGEGADTIISNKNISGSGYEVTNAGGLDHQSQNSSRFSFQDLDRLSASYSRSNESKSSSSTQNKQESIQKTGLSGSTGPLFLSSSSQTNIPNVLSFPVKGFTSMNTGSQDPKNASFVNGNQSGIVPGSNNKVSQPGLCLSYKALTKLKAFKIC